MYGMSSDEFWEQDPKLYWAYRTFYLKKMEEQQLTIDYLCWLAGGYTFQALQTTYGAMFDKDKTKQYSYLDMPMSFKNRELKDSSNENTIANQTHDYESNFNKWARF